MFDGKWQSCLRTIVVLTLFSSCRRWYGENAKSDNFLN